LSLNIIPGLKFHDLIRLLKPLNSSLNMNSRFRDIEKAYRGISTGGYQAVCDLLFGNIGFRVFEV
jgi:hypothetical protein